MAISVRAISTGEGSSGTASASVPTGTAEDDVLIAVVHWNGPPGTVSSSDGFTNKFGNREYNGPSAQYDLFHKVAGASESGSYEWTSDSNRWSVTVLAVSGVDTADIYDVDPDATSENTRGGGSGTVNETNGITTVTDGALIIACAFNDSNSVTFDTTPEDADATWTSQSNLSSQQLQGVATKLKATAGSESAVHWDQSASNGDWINNIFALKPAAEAGGQINWPGFQGRGFRSPRFS